MNTESERLILVSYTFIIGELFKELLLIVNAGTKVLKLLIITLLFSVSTLLIIVVLPNTCKLFAIKFWLTINEPATVVL